MVMEIEIVIAMVNVMVDDRDDGDGATVMRRW